MHYKGNLRAHPCQMQPVQAVAAKQSAWMLGSFHRFSRLDKKPGRTYREVSEETH
jgi:hypothetical protein